MDKQQNRVTTTLQLVVRRACSLLSAWYGRLILGRPGVTLIAIALTTLTIGWFSQDFALDASADSLILERDAELRYYLSLIHI